MLNTISSIFLTTKKQVYKTNYVTSIMAVNVSYQDENPFFGNDGISFAIAICAI